MKVVVEIVLQTVLAFFSILFITRILGRQQVSQLTMQEYVNGITFGSIAATLATDINQRTWHHLIGLFLFGILTFLVSYISVKSIAIARMIQGEPVIVIKEGKILEKNLAKFHYTVDDLNHLLRKKDIFNINEVKFGILENTGEISVIKTAQNENVKVQDLGILGKQEELLIEVIVTGNVIYENLKQQNLTMKWLIDQLKMQGIKDLKEIVYATIDQNNQLYIDRIEDHLQLK
ncbi:YetF domain-containing protein [Clostridium formicaceticum]|uniref:DUF421 domain-containing protein n=1 Tax=Clostridium formicaceticum TaxID=1497 RepID=A0AAC9RI76_9CLOT|nr:DUF421 domain-containing protein [Clostridium formicaceticum]AOY76147.1 hypothetical protein BJL90_09675 [Clostridium formicaceticum]ARE86516.1 hypothetical protein CLFO_08380 [Clostridium formicaceticum]